MFCKNCGKEIADDSRICAYCGTQVAAPAAAPVAAAAPAQEEKLGFNVLGLIGMICGILSLITFFVGGASLLLAIAGLVLSCIGGNQVGKSKGMAKAGKICSIIGLILGTLGLVACIACGGLLGGAANCLGAL